MSSIEQRGLYFLIKSGGISSVWKSFEPLRRFTLISVHEKIC